MSLKKSARFNYIILIYLAGVVFFTLFRLTETWVYCLQSDESIELGSRFMRALGIGWRFDTVVSCFMLALPLILLAIGEFAHIIKKGYYGVIHYLTMTLYTICFLTCAADIPYFCYFFMRFDVSAFTLADSFGATAGMILGEPRYAVFLLVFIAVAVGWWFLGRLIYRRVLLAHLDERLHLAWGIGLTLLLAFMVFAGMRGQLRSKSPIRIGYAHFCDNPFLNQIGLNPVFTFMKSLESGWGYGKPLELADESTVAEVLAEFKELSLDKSLPEATLRLKEGTNVVVIMMESMSAYKTGIMGEENSLTPFLDSLMGVSLTFPQAWSAGIHTHNGIYSTLWGHPALMNRHMMKSPHPPLICGLSQRLGQQGYSTTFFMTHYLDYDNLRGFLHLNGISQVRGQQNYPKKESVGIWGVPDHVMFDHIVDYIDSVAAHGPFLVCAMTCSDHGPYVVPEGIDFKPRNNVMSKKIVEYADWSIAHFIHALSKKPYFENTLFVLIADHGGSQDKTYEMSLSYHHVPLIFFAPGQIEPHTVERLAMQIDVAPTTLGLLGIESGETMMGVNLLDHRRPYAYFSADDKIGVVDDDYFWLFRDKDKRESLYQYKKKSKDDLIDKAPEKASAMRRHAFAMIQASQQMIQNLATSCEYEKNHRQQLTIDN